MIQAESILDNLLSSDKTPSVHYIHFTSENVLYEYCQGFADIINGIKINDRSVFHACSVTKTFTALAILQLAQEGKLSIEKPVKSYWSEFSYPGDITVHQLLSHTAGIPNPIPLSRIYLCNRNTHPLIKNSFLNQFSKNSEE